jgi:hypothetical protein
MSGLFPPTASLDGDIRAASDAEAPGDTESPFVPTAGRKLYCLDGD